MRLHPSFILQVSAKFVETLFLEFFVKSLHFCKLYGKIWILTKFTNLRRFKTYGKHTKNSHCR